MSMFLSFLLIYDLKDYNKKRIQEDHCPMFWMQTLWLCPSFVFKSLFQLTTARKVFCDIFSALLGIMIRESIVGFEKM